MLRCLQYHCRKSSLELRETSWLVACEDSNRTWLISLHGDARLLVWICFFFQSGLLFWLLRSCFQRDSSLTCPFCEFFISITRKLAPIIIDLIVYTAVLLFSICCLFLLYYVTYFVRSLRARKRWFSSLLSVVKNDLMILLSLCAILQFYYRCSRDAKIYPISANQNSGHSNFQIWLCCNFQTCEKWKT